MRVSTVSENQIHQKRGDATDAVEQGERGHVVFR